MKKLTLKLKCKNFFFCLLIFLTTQMHGQQPNVLFLAVDDWNDMMGFMGGNQSITPNLDALAASGVKFINNHAAAAYCTPSRTALMTGLAPWTTGCYGDQPHLYNLPERKTIDELFKENGYKVYGGGKVYHHMPGFVNLDGFDEYYIWNDEQKENGWGYRAWQDNPATPATIGEIGLAVYENFDVQILHDSMENYMADTKVADWAVDFLKQDHQKPFFLAVGSYAPHKPNYAPKKYFDMYPLEEIEIPEQIPEGSDLDDLPEYVYNLYKGRRNNHYNETDGSGLLSLENGWKKGIQGYLASCSYADAQFGKVLNELYQSPYAANTIIVLWSDNGYHLGEKEVWAKHTMWERTTNVPMVWTGPGIANNQTYSGVTSLLDIFPTLVDRCGLTGSEEMDGEVLSNILENPEAVTNNDRAVITSKRPAGDGFNFSVFTNDWHYLSYADGIAEELYDAKNDPNEWYNLAQNPDYATVIDDIKQRVPQDPAEPGLTKSDGLQLITEGETFYWKNPNEGVGDLHKLVEEAPSGEITTITFPGDDSISILTPILIDGKEIIIDGESNNIILDGNEESSLFIITSSGKLTLENISLQNAYNPGDKGGAITGEGDLTMNNCYVINNQTLNKKGGAIALQNSDGYFENCVFRRNTATGSGGAVTVASGNLTFVNCLFDENKVIADKNCLGSAIYTHHNLTDPDWVTKTEIVNCTFVNNIVESLTDAKTGGAVSTGIWNPENQSAKQVVMKIFNSIFWNNTAPAGKGNDVMIFNEADLELYNSIFQYANIIDSDNLQYDDPDSPFFHVDEGEASITVVDNCLDGSLSSVYGDGSTYQSSPFTDFEGGDYTLIEKISSQTNPVINAGTRTGFSLTLPDVDLAGNNRVTGDEIDLGVYESSVITKIGYNESLKGLKSYFGYDTQTLMIRSLDNASNAYLEVYNLAGQLEMKKSVVSNCSIDLSSLEKGFYVIKIDNGIETELLKIIR